MQLHQIQNILLEKALADELGKHVVDKSFSQNTAYFKFSPTIQVQGILDLTETKTQNSTRFQLEATVQKPQPLRI